MKFICVSIAFFITNTITGADFFYAFINPAEKDLALRIFALPSELQDLLFHYLKEKNKATIKEHIQQSLAINGHTQRRYDIEQYFAFKNYGIECIQVVAFYPKKGMRHDWGTKMNNGITYMKGSSANIFWHSLKYGDVNTVDCMEGAKREKVQQKRAPCVYNGIQLYQRNNNFENKYFVFWLNQSNNSEARIIRKDNT